MMGPVVVLAPWELTERLVYLVANMPPSPLILRYINLNHDLGNMLRSNN